MTQIYTTPIVPTLYSGIGILKLLPEKAAYILMFILSNPGKGFQASESESVSIRQFIYEFEQQPQMLCTKLEIAIQYHMNHLLPDPNRGDAVEIACVPKHYQEDPMKYDIEISISGRYYQNEQLIPFYQSNIFEITPDHVLKLKLEGTPYE